mmetsp:Transcript_31457/g.64969  ORF Transcript_31457/g.64969 Transcript_31457/m.64969 type:complete len:208 (-) Transcript_31457:118-741(-)
MCSLPRHASSSVEYLLHLRKWPHPSSRRALHKGTPSNSTWALHTRSPREDQRGSPGPCRLLLRRCCLQPWAFRAQGRFRDPWRGGRDACRGPCRGPCPDPCRAPCRDPCPGPCQAPFQGNLQAPWVLDQSPAAYRTVLGFPSGRVGRSPGLQILRPKSQMDHLGGCPKAATSSFHRRCLPPARFSGVLCAILPNVLSPHVARRCLSV